MWKRKRHGGMDGRKERSGRVKGDEKRNNRREKSRRRGEIEEGEEWEERETRRRGKRKEEEMEGKEISVSAGGHLTWLILPTPNTRDKMAASAKDGSRPPASGTTVLPALTPAMAS